MTLDELYTVLASTGLPVAYNAFASPQALPCIAYSFAFSDNFGADGKVYKKTNRVDINLYTVKKDTVNEALLEQKLDGAGLFYNKSEYYLDGEKAYQISYEVNIDG